MATIVFLTISKNLKSQQAIHDLWVIPFLSFENNFYLESISRIYSIYIQDKSIIPNKIITYNILNHRIIPYCYDILLSVFSNIKPFEKKFVFLYHIINSFPNSSSLLAPLVLQSLLTHQEYYNDEIFLFVIIDLVFKSHIHNIQKLKPNLTLFFQHYFSNTTNTKTKNCRHINTLILSVINRSTILQNLDIPNDYINL